MAINWIGFWVVGIGGMLGCWLRWLLALLLNPLLASLPLGTLAANLVGALLIGMAVGLLEHFHSWPPEVRLFAVTGFLGGLTTFSSFSAESVSLLLRQQYLWFGGNVLLNLIGSLGMTILGLSAVRALLRI